MLTLPEQLMLIALKDEKGTVLFTSAGILPHAITGAVIVELYLAGKIEINEEKLHVKNGQCNSSTLFDEVLKVFSDSGSSKDAKYWILRVFNKVKNIKEKTLNHLVESQVLGLEKQKVLGLFSKTIYPTLDPEPEVQLRNEIRKFILEMEPPDERKAALLAMVQVSRLLDEIFHQTEIKDAKDRIKALLERSHDGDALPEEFARLLRVLVVGIAEASATSGTL